MTATSASTLERPLWASAVTSFVPMSRRAAAYKRLPGLPIALILLVQVALMLRMRNAAFQDEGLYINAGHAYLNHWFGGAAPSHYGTYFSGVPAFYPVLAAGLDQVGGLLLVRVFSAACMLATTWFIYRTGTHLWTRRCGLVSASLYVINGSVLFVGVLATYDSMCVVALAGATYLAITRTSIRSAVACAALLFVAIVTKYTGVVFVPMIAGLAVITHRSLGRGLARGVTIVAIPAVFIAVSLVTWARSLIPGIKFTTVGRHALTYMTYPELLKVVARDCGLLIVVALIGAAMLLRTWRSALLAGLLGGAALVLPFGQIRIHEFTSLDKHLAYSAIYLTLLAGRAAMNLSLRNGRIFVILGLVWVMVLDGLWRSDIFFNGWPNETQVVQVLEQHHPAGNYIAFEADSFSYYLHDKKAMHWQTAYDLFGQGQQAVVNAVHSGTFEGWVFRTHAFGVNSAFANTQAAMLRALASDPQYRRVAHLKAQRYSPGYWSVWEKVTP